MIIFRNAWRELMALPLSLGAATPIFDLQRRARRFAFAIALGAVMAPAAAADESTKPWVAAEVVGGG
jgi:hypothetical protein